MSHGVLLLVPPLDLHQALQRCDPSQGPWWLVPAGVGLWLLHDPQQLPAKVLTLRSFHPLPASSCVTMCSMLLFRIKDGTRILMQ